MDLVTEKFISNFIENQFPQFYQEEGDNFIQFVKAYYEWMETVGPVRGDAKGGPIREARQLLDYRDIDTTVEQFLEFFQKKYLYGIPFNVIINKRFLLKHILDVYRSKGSIQCYKLLFRLIYNEDIEIYLPGKDVLRVSDGKWVQPKYLEVSRNPLLPTLVGKSIVGISSKTTAVVEKYVKESVYRDEVFMLYISNMSPKGGSFEVGERIVPIEFSNDTTKIPSYPIIIGSLQRLDVFNSGTQFNVGDILKIAHVDPDTGEIASYGIEGIVKVISLFRGFGSLNFNILRPGFGFTANADIYLYKNISDVTGQGASFKIGISDTRNLTYNTDPIVGYIDLPINTADYGIPGKPGINANSTLGEALTYSNNVFGKISTLNNVQAGNAYIAPANVFVRSCVTSKNLPGRIYYYRSDSFLSYVSNSFVANTTGVNNSARSILIPNANSIYDANDYVYYSVPTGNTPLGGLNGNTWYYIRSSNSTAITFSLTAGGEAIELVAPSRNPGEIHEVLNDIVFPNTPSVYGYYSNVVANTTSVNNSSYAILIPNADLYYQANDWIYYSVPTGNTAIANLTANSSYFIKTSNSTAITLCTSNGGAVVQISAGTSDPAETHQIKTTTFNRRFVNNDVLYIQANSADSNTFETIMIRQVVNDSELLLYAYPNNTSTNSAVYGIAPPILPAQFAITEELMVRYDNTINGINDRILALNSSGNNIVKDVVAINSGRGYVEGEQIHAYRYGILQFPTIVSGGRGYSNGDTLIFTGGETSSPARGSVLTNSNGTITSINNAPGAWFGGSGYNTLPNVVVRTANGSGAVLTTKFIEFDTANEIRGIVRKGGVGVGLGFWSTTDGQLNNDKYIQDSYYYQDYSYEIKSGLALDKYKDILYNTFHTAGSELFGKFFKSEILTSNLVLVSDSLYANTNWPNWLTCDISDARITCDMADAYRTPDPSRYYYTVRVSEYVYPNTPLTSDINTLECSNTSITLDSLELTP